MEIIGRMDEKPHRKDYWVEIATKKKKLLVFHGDTVLDLTSFCMKHPGGEKAISVYKLKDIKDILFR